MPDCNKIDTRTVFPAHASFTDALARSKLAADAIKIHYNSTFKVVPLLSAIHFGRYQPQAATHGISYRNDPDSEKHDYFLMCSKQPSSMTPGYWVSINEHQLGKSPQDHFVSATAYFDPEGHLLEAETNKTFRNLPKEDQERVKADTGSALEIFRRFPENLYA